MKDVVQDKQVWILLIFSVILERIGDHAVNIAEAILGKRRMIEIIGWIIALLLCFIVAFMGTFIQSFLLSCLW